MLYNITTDGTVQGLFTLVANTVPLGAVLMVVVFAVSFFSMKRHDNLTALVPSIFITFLSALVMFIMGILADYYVLGVATILGVSVILLRSRK